MSTDAPDSAADRALLWLLRGPRASSDPGGPTRDRHVGMTVLEAAGFKYQQWEQDMADGELFKRRQEREDIAAKREEVKP